VIADLEALLLREWDAADHLEGRLRAAEAHLDAGDDAAVAEAVVGVRTAAERCASLALVRALATHAATGGRNTEVRAIVADDGARLALQELTATIERVARRRADLERSLTARAPRRSDLGPPLRV
jgi:hypothetical protein